MDLGNAAAQRGLVFHFADHVGQEEQLTVARACQQRVFRVTGMLDDETRILDPILAAHALEVALPAFAIRRIGKHEVKFHGGECIIGERGTFRTPDQVVGRFPLPLSNRSALAMA